MTFDLTAVKFNPTRFMTVQEYNVLPAVQRHTVAGVPHVLHDGKWCKAVMRHKIKRKPVKLQPLAAAA